MAGTNNPAYGTPNWDMIKQWFAMDPKDDTEFWALNLMQYRKVAAYADGSGHPERSGKDADDAYAPLGPLAAVGAIVALHGDVVHQHGGTPNWDRIGIVRYPSRSAFFAMQQREDFQDAHVHKEAGMEFTIVMSTLPVSSTPSQFADTDRLVLVVERGGAGRASTPAVDVIADFDVEGVIVGDERAFDRAWYARVSDDAELQLIVDAASDADEAHIVVIDRAIDNLVNSIVTAPNAKA